MNSLANLEGARGRFDDARALLAEARRLELSPTDAANLEGYLLLSGGHVELLARNFTRAEELARAGCDDLERQGLVVYLSSELMFLADALIGQGRLDEAQRVIERARPMAAPDDADALLRQARSSAKLAIARADYTTAEAEARASLEHVEKAQAPDEHAECLLVLADALLALGRDTEAREAAAALALAEAREHLVAVQRARALLDAVSVMRPSPREWVSG